MKRIGKLTPREVEVLKWVARRKSEAQIAARLHISIHTVRFHIKNICSKLGARNRWEAVLIGLLKGYIGLEDVLQYRA